MTPSEAYLLTLRSITSRKSMKSCLNNIASILSDNEVTNHTDFDWSGLDQLCVHQVIGHLELHKRSPKTINTYLSCMKGVARQLKISGAISRDEYGYISDIKGFKGSHNKKGRYLTIDEVRKLIDHCFYKDDVKSLRDAVLMIIIYGAGLRRSEAANLELSSINLKKSEMKIIGKGNKGRIIHLNERAIDMIEHWLDKRGRHDGALFVQIRKGGHITSNKISPQSIYNIVVQRYKEAGLDRLSPHDLRHTFASNLLNQGTNIKVVQEILGHENIETTSVYAHSSDEAKKDAINNLLV